MEWRGQQPESGGRYSIGRVQFVALGCRHVLKTIKRQQEVESKGRREGQNLQ